MNDVVDKKKDNDEDERHRMRSRNNDASEGASTRSWAKQMPELRLLCSVSFLV